MSKLTRIRHNKRRQARKRLIGRDIEPSIIQGLDFIMLHMVPPAFLPILHAQAEPVRVVLGRSDQEGTAGIVLS